MSDNIPAGLKYTTDHEWANIEGARVKVGVTAFAVEQLGDVTLVDINVKVGDELAEGKAFGTIESVKTLSDLLSPVAGKVVEINMALSANPELVNEDCYGKAWMIVIKPSDPAAVGALLDDKAYAEHVKSQ
ncbi:MAG: glycine cleavage system protein GcvH [Polyangiaceae bacterium]|nr:glycine cleavage system protein GcvH [Polyangiaceae bacterium]